MPSTNKTSLGLNQWVGADKPKWADFNQDNLKLDEELKKRAALDTSGRVKQDALNALALGGHSYESLFDETGKAVKAKDADTSNSCKIAANATSAVKAANSDRLGGVLAKDYPMVDKCNVSLLNGFKNRTAGTVITFTKVGNVVSFSEDLTGTPSSSDRVACIIPAGFRPGYMLQYKHFLQSGYCWVRDNGELMIQSKDNAVQFYGSYTVED